MGKKFLREYSDEEYCDGLDTSAYDYSDAFYDEIMDNIHSRDEYEDLMGERMPEDEIERRINNDDFVRNNIYENKRKKMKITEGLIRHIIRESLSNLYKEDFEPDFDNNYEDEDYSDEEIANGLGLLQEGYEDGDLNYAQAMELDETVKQVVNKVKDKLKKGANAIDKFADKMFDEPVQKKVGTIGDSVNGEGNLTRAKKKIQSMVKEAISELSRDTMDSAADKAGKEAYRYGYNTPEGKKRQEQYRTFSDGVDKTVGDNPRAQLKLSQEREARKNGTRTYKNGKWSYNK